MKLYLVSLPCSQEDASYFYRANSAQEAANLYVGDALAGQLTLDLEDFESDDTILDVDFIPPADGMHDAPGLLSWEDIQRVKLRVHDTPEWRQSAASDDIAP